MAVGNIPVVRVGGGTRVLTPHLELTGLHIIPVA